jgi:flagellar protein FliO/FliZ
VTPALSAAGLALLLAQAVETRQEDSGAGLAAREFNIWPYVVNLAVALAVVIGLILLVTWLMKVTMGRRFSFGGSGMLQVVASVPLGDRRFISVLRVGERYYLVGISSAEISLLSTLDPDEIKPYLEKSPQQGEGGFAGLLRRLRGETPSEKDGSQS